MTLKEKLEIAKTIGLTAVKEVPSAPLHDIQFIFVKLLEIETQAKYALEAIEHIEKSKNNISKNKETPENND